MPEETELTPEQISAQVPELEGTFDPQSEFDQIPDSVLQGVLGQWGYGQDANAVDDEEEEEEGNPDEESDDSETPLLPEPDAEPEPDEGGVPTFVPVPGGPIAPQPEPKDPDEPPTGQPLTDPAKTQPEGQPLTWAQVRDRVQTDPEYARYITAQLGANPPAATPTPTPAKPPVKSYQDFGLPPLPDGWVQDLKDQGPAGEAVLNLLTYQNNLILDTNAKLLQVERSTQQKQYEDNTRIVASAYSNFKETYNIPDQVMEKVRDNAANGSDIDKYMSGIDPRTGKAVIPNPYEAIKVGLERAYWLTPEARSFEFQRQQANVAQTRTRKTKLGGVGGSSASASRAPKPIDTSTREGLHRAAIDEVAAAMFGDGQ